MVEIRKEFRSKEEWDEWVAANRPNFPIWRDNILSAVRSKGLVEPVTGLRRLSEDIWIDEKNLRESITAAGTNSRERAALLILSLSIDIVPPKKRNNPKILGTAALSASARLLRGKFPYFLGSEYLPSDELRELHFPIRHIDLTSLEVPSRSFDIFYSEDALEHASDLKVALSEICGALRPDSLAIFTVPFAVGREDTLIKARLVDGAVEHILSPEYHVSPGGVGRGLLVYSIPGWDILGTCREVGFSDPRMIFVMSEEFGVCSSGAPGVFVLVAERRRTASDQSRRSVSEITYTGPALQRVVGLLSLPRSGSTLLNSILSVHSDVKAVYEPWNANKGISFTHGMSLGEFMEVFKVDLGGKTNLVVKETATQLEYVDNLSDLLASVVAPLRTELVVLLRNPIHVFLSEVQARKDWWGEKDIQISIQVFDRWADRTVLALKKLLDAAVRHDAVMISYEFLVASKDLAVARLMGELGLRFEEIQLNFEQHFDKSQVRGDVNLATNPIGISRSSVERRQREAADMATLLEGSRFGPVIARALAVCSLVESVGVCRLSSASGEAIREMWGQVRLP
jgi:SAM-dependent methyltransferase